MQQFVMIFRQPATPLSDADTKQRNAEIRAWAQTQNAAGHQLDPHMLNADGQLLKPAGDTEIVVAAQPGVLSGLLFFQANDFEQAIQVVRAHPALRYGSTIEVRSWTPPAPPAAG